LHKAIDPSGTKIAFKLSEIVMRANKKDVSSIKISDQNSEIKLFYSITEQLGGD